MIQERKLLLAQAIVCLALLTLATGCPQTDGTPTAPGGGRLFTFEGSITLLEDGAGAAAAAGVTASTPVKYQVVIDVDADGYTVDNNGNVVTLVDSAGTNYLYAGYHSGALVDEVNGGCHNSGADVAEFHFGSEGQPGDQAQVIIGSGDHTIVLYNGIHPVSTWGVGSVVGSAEEAWNSSGEKTGLYCVFLWVTSVVDL